MLPFDPMNVDLIELPTLSWPKGSSARMWFCQPQVELTTRAPYRPTNSAQSLDILRVVLDADAQKGAPVGGGPSIVLLPELSIDCADIPVLRALLRGARNNTLLICGVGHMTAAEIDTIEASTKLCGDPVAEC